MIYSPCDCLEVEVSSNTPEIKSRDKEAYGKYKKLNNPLRNGYPAYKHESKDYFLYKYVEEDVWAIGSQLGSQFIRLQNRGNDNTKCPYYLKSHWEFQNSTKFDFDPDMRVVCNSDPCSKARCGQQAECTVSESKAICKCKDNFFGNPYKRCFPKVPRDFNCKCLKSTLSSRLNLLSPQIRRHRLAFGDYFLYDIKDNHPLYQHSSGIYYLYKYPGEYWLIDDDISTTFGKIQNLVS